MTRLSPLRPAGRVVPLDELPRYTAWPARLLQAAAAVGYVKDRANILREFDRDKWGVLLAQLRRLDTADLAALEQLISPSGEQRLYVHSGSLFLATAEAIQTAYLGWLAETIEAFGRFDVIGELGGGAGNLVLHLARHMAAAKRWISYELTDNGRAITELVAAREGLPVDTAPVDFEQRFVRAGAAAAGLYFSSFALAYCADPYPFLASLLDDGASRLLLVEPMYQLYDDGSLLGLLARRYVEYHGYSKGVWPAVQRLADDGRLEIAALDANFFGHNPLCPMSAVQLVVTRR